MQQKPPFFTERNYLFVPVDYRQLPEFAMVDLLDEAPERSSGAIGRSPVTAAILIISS